MIELYEKESNSNEHETVYYTAVKMQEDYAKNQAYSPKDLQYVLGDPIRGVGIVMDSACGSNFRIQK